MLAGNILVPEPAISELTSGIDFSYLLSQVSINANKKETTSLENEK